MHRHRLSLAHRSLGGVARRPQLRQRQSGRATDLELSWQQALSILPGPLGGLGANVNATFNRGSSEPDELVPGTMADYRKFTVDFLPERPKRVYNVQLWWEKYGESARVAVNRIGEFVRTSGGLTSFLTSVAATRVDCSLSYRINRRFTIYVEGRNLTDEVTSWFATTKSRPEEYFLTGAVCSGGVQFRF